MIGDAIVTAIRARLTVALVPPGEPMLPLRVDGHAAGWLDRGRADRLAAFDNIFLVDDRAIRFLPQLDDAPARSRAVDRVARALAREGALTAWRDERYAAAPGFGAPPWFVLERAAARYFGIRTFAAHVNGLVLRPDGISMWFARRSPVKAIDPGMLDNLVGGGIAEGQTVAGTVLKESWEEAGIGATLAASANPAGAIDLCRKVPDGLQRETVFVHDLVLPRDFSPAGQDGEVVGHYLVDLDAAATLIAADQGPDTVTVDASLVVLDCLLRRGASFSDPLDRPALEALCRPGPSPFD